MSSIQPTNTQEGNTEETRETGSSTTTGQDDGQHTSKDVQDLRSNDRVERSSATLGTCTQPIRWVLPIEDKRQGGAEVTDRERLHELCVEMGVPTYRLTNADGGIDVGWLSRNMGISFFEKPGFEEASVLVKKIRREEFKR